MIISTAQLPRYFETVSKYLLWFYNLRFMNGLGICQFEVYDLKVKKLDRSITGKF